MYVCVCIVWPTVSPCVSVLQPVCRRRASHAVDCARRINLPRRLWHRSAAHEDAVYTLIGNSPHRKCHSQPRHDGPNISIPLLPEELYTIRKCTEHAIYSSWWYDETSAAYDRPVGPWPHWIWHPASHKLNSALVICWLAVILGLHHRGNLHTSLQKKCAKMHCLQRQNFLFSGQRAALHILHPPTQEESSCPDPIQHCPPHCLVAGDAHGHTTTSNVMRLKLSVWYIYCICVSLIQPMSISLAIFDWLILTTNRHTDRPRYMCSSMPYFMFRTWCNRTSCHLIRRHHVRILIVWLGHCIVCTPLELSYSTLTNFPWQFNKQI